MTYTVLLHLRDFLDFCLDKTSELDGKDRVAANQKESETVVQILKCATSNMQTQTLAKKRVQILANNAENYLYLANTEVFDRLCERTVVMCMTSPNNVSTVNDIQ